MGEPGVFCFFVIQAGYFNSILRINSEPIKFTYCTHPNP